ncbi:LCP family protein [Microbacterium oryzae]|uniref:LCP family protein n=1 Tax=Microbacterium oryzae TaxID=743009 RepID=UPI0025AFCB83|nr:LCP family protein [Microbacterium oryzae]MDN3310169.1 LCP family protein [Microbacterium oryzae]
MSDNRKHDTRRTIARHGRLTSPSPLRQLLRVLGVAVSVLLVSGVGVASYAAWDFGSTFSADAVVLEGQDASPPDIGALDNEGVNILFAGLDACEEEYKQYFGGRCPDDAAYDPDSRDSVLNDVNMLVHISPEPRRVTVISFPRDLMVEAPECTDPQGDVASALTRSQLNEAYYRGDLGCIVKTIEQLSGQTIDYGATVTWGGVIEITNAIGGVNVCVGGEGIYDEHTGLAIPPSDNYTLVGVEALQFLRTRHGVGDGSDLGRISNQQVYMSALARKLMSEEVLTDPATLLTLARTTLQNVDPSSSLTNPVTLVQIAMAAKDVPLDEFTFVQYPVVSDPYDVNRVAPDYASAEALWAALEENVPLELTGDTGGGAVLAEGEDGAETPAPEDTATPVETEAPSDPSATPSPTETPADGELGANVHGSDASQVTCSNGAG